MVTLLLSGKQRTAVTRWLQVRLVLLMSLILLHSTLSGSHRTMATMFSIDLSLMLTVVILRAALAP